MMKSKNPADMMTAVSKSMQDRTGKSLEKWVAIVQASGIDPLDQSGVRRWLKAEHGLLQNTQWAIADAVARAAGWKEPTVEEYINQQYSGAKQEPRPIFDRLRTIIEGLGEDVHAEGRKTYIPFVRSRQFAAVAPATRTRIDVGIRYTTPPDSPLLSPSKGPGQGTHKLSLTSPEEVTDQIHQLLHIAYEQN